MSFEVVLYNMVIETTGNEHDDICSSAYFPIYIQVYYMDELDPDGHFVAEIVCTVYYGYGLIDCA